MMVLVLNKSITLQPRNNIPLRIRRLPFLSSSSSIQATYIVIHLMYLLISLLSIATIITTATTTMITASASSSLSSSKLYLSSIISRKFQKKLLLYTSTRASLDSSSSASSNFLPNSIHHYYDYQSHRTIGFHNIPLMSSNTYSFVCKTNRNNQGNIRISKPNFLQCQQSSQQQQLTSRTKMLLFSSKVDTNDSNKATTATTNPTTTATTTILETPLVIPRAAVSIVLQYTMIENETNDPSIPTGSTNYYLLIRRGKPPSMGLWSFPGGKLEYGETTMNGAKRELMEEVQVSSSSLLSSSISTTTTDNTIKDTANTLNWNDIIQWYPEPVMTTDAYGDGYHYLIAQCYGEVRITTATTSSSSESLELQLQQVLPKVIACDDAKDAKWFTLQEIKQMASNSQQLHVVIGAPHVIQRIEQLSKAGMLLPCQ